MDHDPNAAVNPLPAALTVLALSSIIRALALLYVCINLLFGSSLNPVTYSCFHLWVLLYHPVYDHKNTINLIGYLLFVRHPSESFNFLNSRKNPIR